jgi:hypothetical protein
VLAVHHVDELRVMAARDALDPAVRDVGAGDRVAPPASFSWTVRLRISLTRNLPEPGRSSPFKRQTGRPTDRPAPLRCSRLQPATTKTQAHSSRNAITGSADL